VGTGIVFQNEYF